MTPSHDLVVVGGGLAGTMAVLVASTRGLDVAWVADAPGPSAQSAQWHAHLHRGRLYDPVREAELIAELRQNAPFWWSDPVARFHTGIPTMAIGPDAAWAEQFRGILGGHAGERVRPTFLRASSFAVRTDEAVLRGPQFLTAAAGVAASRSRRIDGRATRLRRSSGEWTVSVGTGSGETEVRARDVIVATGTAIDELLPGSVRLDHPHGTRLSRMLVIRGDLPRAAAIVPSRAAGGLFFASRDTTDGSGDRVWLVSDGFNSPGEESPGALTDAWWACSIVERLTGFVRQRVLEGTRVAAYTAAKSRLEASPTQVPARGISVDADQRLVALTPSKGSASPTAAIDALDALHPDPLPLEQRRDALIATLEGARVPTTVFPERWEQLDPSVPFCDLVTPGLAALEAGAALYPSGDGSSRLERRGTMERADLR